MCFDFGRAADQLLAYHTEKVVRLKHARVGCLYYTLVLLVLFYIVGVQLLYNNDQFDKRAVSGTPRLSIQHPTAAGCNPRDRLCVANFSSLAALPYCDVYGGAGPPAAEVQRGCTIADKHTLLPQGALGPSMLVPTRIDRATESRACGVLSGTNGTCGGSPARVTKSERNFVADIERFTVMVSHSYRRDTMSGNDNRVLGYYQECLAQRSSAQRVSEAVFGASACPGTAVLRPIECLDSSCHFTAPAGGSAPAAGFLQRDRSGGGRAGGGSRGSPRADGGRAWQLLEDGVFALPDGDVFTVQKLLELAGVASLDRERTLDGLPLREQGVVVDIAVRYTNLYPLASSFGHGDVRYEYVVSLQPAHHAQNEIVVASSEDGSERVLETRHGLYFTVRVEGYFGFFSIVNLLLALAEGATLMAVATVVTDKIAVYVLEDADDNFHAKYKEVRRDAPAGGGEGSSRGEAAASGSGDRS